MSRALTHLSVEAVASVVLLVGAVMVLREKCQRLPAGQDIGALLADAINEIEGSAA